MEELTVLTSQVSGDVPATLKYTTHVGMEAALSDSESVMDTQTAGMGVMSLAGVVVTPQSCTGVVMGRAFRKVLFVMAMWTVWTTVMNHQAATKAVTQVKSLLVERETALTSV